MKDIQDLKKGIKTFSFVFTFILFLYPIKALFAFMENDFSYLGMVINNASSSAIWIKFGVKFIASILFFIGFYNLIKTLNFKDIEDIFSIEKILLFKKTGFYFLRAATVGSLTIFVDIFNGKFSSLKMSTDFIFILYFSLIMGFFFYFFSRILEKAKEVKQENDLTI
ncbi:DUF2975 domain-containing protein [uncultured Polaribacter sp.]|uniref:DUF2975 domain-containing protein n=1 Tax=uncultured Polaribacter sp. TaxID=174711 RepID=UPI0026222D50|nr:DUF2975 domain-containing protein [uncultured Polaribacter sp.]